MNRRLQQVDPEMIILILAAILLAVAIPRYSVAFQAAEAPLQLWGDKTVNVSPATGFLFALGYEGTAWVGFWQGMAARRRAEKTNLYRSIWWWPELAALLQTIVGFGCILVPVSVAQLRQVRLVTFLGQGWDVAWCAAVMLAPALASLTASAVIAVQVQASQRATAKASAATLLAAQATQNAPTAVADPPKAPALCRYCGEPAKSVNARNAHERFCAKRPVADTSGAPA